MVQRLYWIQFESFLSSKPQLRFNYDSKQHSNLGGSSFIVDSWVRSSHDGTKPGSDREHIETLIRAAGFTMPAEMIYLAGPQRDIQLLAIFV